MRKKKIIFNLLFGLLFIAIPNVMSAQDIDPPPPYEEIDPPPASSIDTSIVFLLVAGIAFAAYYFYKTNSKMEKK
jgi:hypothetical protein